MPALTFFLSSNAVQLAATLMAGVLTYLILFCTPKLQSWSRLDVSRRFVTDKPFVFSLEIVGVGLLFIIISCFLFDLSETYYYSDFYKRSFGPFGDGFPFVYLFLLNIGFFAGRKRLVIIAVILSLLSGSKIVLTSLILSIVFLKFITPKMSLGVGAKHYLFTPIATYILLLLLSNFVFTDKLKENVQNYIQNIVTVESKSLGRGACKSVNKCMDTQIASAAKQRIITSKAGIWMTHQGKFGGAEYPGTAKKFADFMMYHNPYGMNERYDLDWNFWASAGGVQHPYINIGSGYGYIGLIIILVLFFGTAFRGLKHLCSKGKYPDYTDGFTVFFVSLVFLNQTQQWVQSASILLFLSGFCMAHIWKLKPSHQTEKQND